MNVIEEIEVKRPTYNPGSWNSGFQTGWDAAVKAALEVLADKELAK